MPGPSDAPQPVSSQRGTGFVNLQQFLNANQGNQLGQNIGNSITQAGQNTESGLGTANQQFQSDVQQNSYNNTNNQNQASNTINQANNLGDGTNGSATNLDPNSLQQFQTWSQGQYSGPQTLNNASQLGSQGQQVSQFDQSINNPTGRLGLLQNFIGGGGNYTQGEANLDNMLLGSAPQLKQAQQQTQGVSQDVNRSLNLAQQQAQNAAAGNQQFGNSILQQANTAYGNYGANLQNQANQDWTNQDTQYNQDLTGLKNRNIQSLPQSFSSLNGTASFNVDPTAYLSEVPQSQINAQTIANQSDVNRLNALAQLAGTSNNVVNQVSSTPYDPTSGVNFNSAGYNAARQAQQAQYQNVLNNTNVEFNGSNGDFSGGGAGLVQGTPAVGPGNTLENITQALPQLAQQAALAQQQLAAGGYSGIFQPTIDQYNSILAAYNNLQKQYGATDYFGTPPTQMGGGIPTNPSTGGSGGGTGIF